MKRTAVVLLVIVALGLVAGGYWFSQKRVRPYEGLAERFPAKTQVFVEVRELGQWMDIKDAEGGVPASASNRGVDPMMQVLGQVWAAQPVRPAELPELLRNQPVAMGFWKEGDTVKGAALMPLGPGQAKALGDFFKEKLGEGDAVATVAGVTLKKVKEFQGEEHVKDLIWGVSDTWAVVATGADEVRMVLEPAGDRLVKDPVFEEALNRISFERGAFFVVKGDLLAQYAKEKLAGRKTQPVTLGEEEPKAEEPKGAEPKGNAPKVAEPKTEEPKAGSKEAPPPGGEPGTGADSSELSMVKGLGDIAAEAYGKVLALESLKSLTVWTSPPEGDQKGWQVKGYLALNDSPKGMWRVVTEGSPARPEILNRLPKDAKVYVWGGGQDPARVYQVALDEVQKDLPPDQAGWVRASIGAAEGKLGLSFANDLLPTISDEWCYVGDMKGEKEDGHKRFAFFVGLRDPRRFEGLVNEKLAVQLKLKSEQLQGARAWSWGGGEGPKAKLVVAGGVAIFTDDPEWALATAGAAGKAYEQLAKYGEKASGICIVDPLLWNKDNDVLTRVAWRSGPSGLEVDARFPGQPPKMWGKGCEGKKEAVTGSSPEEPPAPKASVSL